MSPYSSWIRRAECFVRQLNYLPGCWGISVEIEPPVSDDDAEELAGLLPFGLPGPLRALYTEGASRCRCRYNWTPDGKHLPLVQEVFPHQRSFGGGVEFISWTDLQDAHGLYSFPSHEEGELTEEQAKARDIWHHTVPFIHIGNGDRVALHFTGDPLRMPVVYLCHDDPETPVTTLSPSFDRFLADWESLCYIGPEIWLLHVFLGKEGVDVENDIVQRWREVILTCGKD